MGGSTTKKETRPTTPQEKKELDGIMAEFDKLTKGVNSMLKKTSKLFKRE